MKEINITKIKRAATELAQISERERNTFLRYLGEILWKQKDEIIAANKKDVNVATKMHLPNAFVQRLILDEVSITNIIKKLMDLQKIASNVGEIIEEKKLRNGLLLKKIVTQIGIIAVIYESRPEVTIDVAALCIKSGNAVILKSGKEAVHTNRVLQHCINEGLKRAEINKYVVTLVYDRQTVTDLISDDCGVDLVIARGSYNLVKSIINNSKVPVLAHSAGGARIYVDKSADMQIVEAILINAKTSKPSACNSLDTIILHTAIVKQLFPKITSILKHHNVEVIDTVWDTEFLGLKVSIKIVKNVDEAIQFINTYSNKHSEGIIACDQRVIDKFTSQIDSAALFVNCSTRFHDGYEFGMGAEMGIATGKLHARGPVGLKELSTYKWIVYGNGQIRT